MFGNDDLFGDEPPSQPSKPTKPTKDNDFDDIFGTPKPSIKNPLEDDLFGEEIDKPVKQEKPVSIKPVPQVTDDDLFGEPVKPKEPVKPVPQVTPVDDLFDEPVKPKKPVKPVPQVTPVDDLFDEPVKPKKPVKPVPQVNDDDLFSDLIKQDKPVTLDEQPNKLPANLFSVSPPPPSQPTKTDDEDGDLFASLGPTPKPKKPSTPVVNKPLPTEAPPNKSVPKPSDKPSIFTDIPTIDQEITKLLDTGKRDDDIFASSPPGQKPPDTNVSKERERERENGLINASFLIRLMTYFLKTRNQLLRKRLKVVQMRTYLVTQTIYLATFLQVNQKQQKQKRRKRQQQKLQKQKKRVEKL